MLKRSNGVVTQNNVQEKEGAVVCFDTVLGSFQTFQDSLILAIFRFTYQNTMDLDKHRFGAVFFWHWQCAEEGKKKSSLENCFVLYSEICHSNMTKVFTPSQWIPLQKDSITQKFNIYKLQP